MVDEKTTLPDALKSGWRSTEFWITLLLMSGGFALLYKGREELGAILLGLAGVPYPAWRSFLKKTAVMALALVWR